MMKRVLSILLILIAISLMVTPYGIAMTFASGPKETLTKYFSYFSITPFGYGNWFPIITALLSIVILVLLIIDFKKENMGRAIQICLSICIGASILSWLIFDAISVIAVCIFAIHFTVRVLQRTPNHRDKEE